MKKVIGIGAVVIIALAGVYLLMSGDGGSSAMNYQATYNFKNTATLTGITNNSEGTITVYVMGDKVREDVRVTKKIVFTTGTLTNTVVADRSYFYGTKPMTCYHEADTQEDPGCEEGIHEHPVDRGFQHEGYLAGSSYISGTLTTAHGSKLIKEDPKSAGGLCVSFTDGSEAIKSSNTRTHCFNKEEVYEYFSNEYKKEGLIASQQSQVLTGVTLGTVTEADFTLN